MPLAKELTDILTKIAPIEQGAGSVDTPILKKIYENKYCLIVI
jgi:hypothetical protein